MSAPKFKLELSERAYDDLRNIQIYTFTEHGEQQWQKYEQVLNEALLHIQHHPHTGHSRTDIPNTHKAWKAGEHIIIFRLKADTIIIVRVLHAKMDFRNKI